MRLPPEGSSLPTQKQGPGWETSASPSAARRAAGERESIPPGEPAGRLRSAEEEARAQSREMTWQRSPGAGAEPGNSMGIAPGLLPPPATARLHRPFLPACRAAALTIPGATRLVSTGGFAFSVRCGIKIYYHRRQVMRARNWGGRHAMGSLNWENQSCEGRDGNRMGVPSKAGKAGEGHRALTAAAGGCLVDIGAKRKMMLLVGLKRHHEDALLSVTAKERSAVTRVPWITLRPKVQPGLG